MASKNKLFVGNLSYDFEVETLRDVLTQIFSEYGTVEKVEVPIDRMSGRTKGIAFVTMTTDDEAAQAQEGLNGYELGIDDRDDRPRPMKIDVARPLQPRTDFNKGGGDYNRGGGSNSYGNNRRSGGYNNRDHDRSSDGYSDEYNS